MMTCPITQRTYGTSGGWWPCEMVALRSMMKDGYRWLEISEVLDRQYSAVFSKGNQLKKLEQTA